MSCCDIETFPVNERVGFYEGYGEKYMYASDLKRETLEEIKKVREECEPKAARSTD